MNNRSRGQGLNKYFPILDWLPHYKPEWLRFDIIAALSVWALLVPQGIAYASIAGMPAQFGLYAGSGLPAWLRPIWHRRAGHYRPKRGDRSRIGFRHCTLGNSRFIRVDRLHSHPGCIRRRGLPPAWMVQDGLGFALSLWGSAGGFVFGFGVGLIVDQTPKILGVPKAQGSYFQVLVGSIKALPETSIPTLIVGASSILLLLLMRRFLPKLPRTIIVVVLGIIVSSLLGLADYGVSVVGPIPTGLPSIVWPSLPPVSLSSLILGSLAIIFIGFSESLAAAKEEGSKYDYEIDASQEMVAQGMANTASGLLGGFSVEGSLSKTTVADLAGQKTQLASLITAGLILLTILFLAGFFTTLPQAVLGAVVIDAGISLVKIKELRHYRLSRRDFAAFLATALVVFFIGVLAGVVAGVLLSLLLLIVSASRTPVRRMAFDKENNVYVHTEHHPEAELTPGIVVVGIHGPLFFADADNFRKSVMEMVAEDRPHSVVIDLSAVIMMDMDGDKILTKLTRELGKKNVQVLLVNVGSDNLELMRKTGTLEEIGSENIYRTARAAVSAARKAAGESQET
jgi:SulP family sulfate permease